MSVAKITRDFVTNIEGAKLFTYDDIPCLNKTSAAIELSRLFKKGIIKKVSKGKFYKPKIRVFGEVAPNTNDKIKSYLKLFVAIFFKHKKYITNFHTIFIYFKYNKPNTH